MEEKNREAEAEKGGTVIKIMKNEIRVEKDVDIEVAVKTEIKTSTYEAEVEAKKES